ncbi:GlsB/YeaQ/YmgE family stress response membrane protein [Longispora urticae]
MTLAAVLSALLVGIVVGVVERLALPGHRYVPTWVTMLIGALAAVIGTVIVRGLGLAETRGVATVEVVVQLVLAAGCVALAVAVSSRRAGR